MRKEIAHPAQPVFDELLQHIQQARSKAFRQANTVLIDLYWRVGKTISEKVQTEVWGKGVVAELARYIARQAPDIRGFSDKNLWRMKQFYETYRENEKLSTLLRELPWSHNLAIFARCKSEEERAFYLNLCIREKYSFRELDRQISASFFERSLMGTLISPVAREIAPHIHQVFKDNYILEFVGLPDMHSENDLQKALVQHMKQFILELGPDFIFMGEQYRSRATSRPPSSLNTNCNYPIKKSFRPNSTNGCNNYPT